MAEKAKPTCIKCGKELRIICVEPATGRTLKVRAEHQKDIKTHDESGQRVYLFPMAFVARSTMGEKRKELAARCPYEGK